MAPLGWLTETGFLNDQVQTMMTTTNAMTQTRRRRVPRNGCCASSRRRTNGLRPPGTRSALGDGISRDPVEAGNLYVFAGNGGISSYDVLALWDSGVHRDRTIVWATALKYPEDAATTIGNADAAVDGGPIGWGRRVFKVKNR